MGDIYFGIAIIGLLSVGSFFLASQLATRLPRRLGDFLGPAVILAMLLYIRDVWDNLLLARILPFSNVIILGNWFPLATCFLAGLAWQKLKPSRIRRSVCVVLLAAIGGCALVYPLQGAPPQCLDIWSEGVSIQTTWNTCSAASAATLLKAYRIPATEQEMAELCLTRKGTHWQGLYRGLKLKTANTPWKVEVLSSCGIDDLRHFSLGGPIILTVELDEAANADPRYSEEWGWIPGVSHSTVLFGFISRDLLEVGDPANGRERWDTSDLKLLWHGRAMRLVHR